MDSRVLKINEIFYSIQGESTKAGLPCIFVRLTYCNIRCVYCDTEYAFYEGVDRTIDDIVDKIKTLQTTACIDKYNLVFKFQQNQTLI